MSYDFQPTFNIYQFSSSSSMTLERISPSSLSSPPTSTQPSSTSAYSPHMKISSYFTSPPSGAAVPLSPPDVHQVRALAGSNSFGDRRGYSYTIVFEPTKAIGRATVAKGDLEPRAGALPRRTRKKRVSALPKVVESKGFDLLIGSGPPSDDSDNDK